MLLGDVTKIYLVGLVMQCLLEITTRTFYARQNTIIPVMVNLVSIITGSVLGSILASLSKQEIDVMK